MATFTTKKVKLNEAVEETPVRTRGAIAEKSELQQMIEGMDAVLKLTEKQKAEFKKWGLSVGWKNVCRHIVLGWTAEDLKNGRKG